MLPGSNNADSLRTPYAFSFVLVDSGLPNTNR